MVASLALLELEAAGLTVELDDDQLIVRPRDRLTDELRAFIRQHKDDLVREALYRHLRESHRRKDWNALGAFEERGRILARINPNLVTDGLLMYPPSAD